MWIVAKPIKICVQIAETKCLCNSIFLVFPIYFFCYFDWCKHDLYTIHLSHYFCFYCVFYIWMENGIDWQCQCQWHIYVIISMFPQFTVPTWIDYDGYQLAAHSSSWNFNVFNAKKKWSVWYLWSTNKSTLWFDLIVKYAWIIFSVRVMVYSWSWTITPNELLNSKLFKGAVLAKSPMRAILLADNNFIRPKIAYKLFPDWMWKSVLEWIFRSAKNHTSSKN